MKETATVMSEEQKLLVLHRFTGQSCEDYDDDCEFMTLTQIMACSSCPGPFDSKGQCRMTPQLN